MMRNATAWASRIMVARTDIESAQGCGVWTEFKVDAADGTARCDLPMLNARSDGENVSEPAPADCRYDHYHRTGHDDGDCARQLVGGAGTVTIL